VGLVGGFIEELGWTGFAVPGLKPRYGVLATGLIVGFLWGAWHVPITLWSTGTWTLFVGPLFFYVAVLPAYRVLMVWVYDGTGSILVPMLMHVSLIASTLYILLPPAQGGPLVTYYLVLAAALWVAVLAIVLLRAEKRPARVG
jgi:membrane protease YdiL (CAAX protease family)